MVEVTVVVNYLGKNFQTNVITNKFNTQEEIMRLAKEQVIKQWNF